MPWAINSLAAFSAHILALADRILRPLNDRHSALAETGQLSKNGLLSIGKALPGENIGLCLKPLRAGPPVPAHLMFSAFGPLALPVIAAVETEPCRASSWIADDFAGLATIGTSKLIPDAIIGCGHQAPLLVGTMVIDYGRFMSLTVNALMR